MHGKLSPFQQYGTVDEVNYLIWRELEKYPHRRQVVSILLLSDDQDRLILQRSAKSERDKNPTFSPPQGEVRKSEKLFVAGSRQVKKELGVMTTNFRYLGSSLRSFPEGVSQRGHFIEYHYHWMLAHAESDRLTLASEVAEATWCHIETIHLWALQTTRSPEKRIMFTSAFNQFCLLTGRNNMISLEAFERAGASAVA